MENNPRYIISTINISIELKKIMTHLAPAAVVLEYHAVIEHRIDCYLLGTHYQSFIDDPLTDIFQSFNVPSDHRTYINHLLTDLIHETLVAAIGYINPTLDYVIDWTNPSIGVIEAVPSYGTRVAKETLKVERARALAETNGGYM